MTEDYARWQSETRDVLMDVVGHFLSEQQRWQEAFGHLPTIDEALRWRDAYEAQDAARDAIRDGR